MPRTTKKTLALALAAILAAASSGCADGAAPYEDTTSAALRAGEPRTVFTGELNARAIASDGENVYWTESRSIEVRKTALSGGPHTVLWKGRGMDSLGLIHFDRGFVYFTEDGRILRVPSTGGAVEELARLRFDLPFEIATDDAYVYWGGETDFASDYVSYIHRIKKTGGPIETVYKGYKGFDSFVVGAGYVYFAGSDHDIIMNPPHRLMRVPSAGGTPEQLLELTGMVRAMTADASTIYFSTVVDRAWTIQSLAMTGGNASRLVELPLGTTNEPATLVVGATSLFWQSPGTFDFSRTPADNHDAHVYGVDKKLGGSPTTLASNIDSPSALVLAGSCPVWSTLTTIQTTTACAVGH